MSRVGMFGMTLHELGPWSAGSRTGFIGRAPLSRDGSLTMPGFHDMACERGDRVAPAAPVNPGGVTVHPGEPREFRVSLNQTP